MTDNEILILASDTDSHALVVAEALKHIGIKHYLLSHREFPQHQSISFDFDSHKHTNLAVTRLSDSIILNNINTIWFRRELSAVPHPSLDKPDREFTAKQCEVVLSGIEAATPNSRWINPRNAALLAENKIFQLQTAKKIGLQIPATLISNNSENIFNFVKKHQAIYKPLSGFVWSEDDKRKATYTRKINIEDLNNGVSLHQCPSIFQELIQPEYEVRILMLGSQALAIRIKTEQEHPTVRDWRFMQNKYVQATPTEIPETIKLKCQELLSSMSLKTASFDFIVDKFGTWYFIEINQAGQFLFIEEWCPELPVLAAFCVFLSECEDEKMRQQTYAEIKLKRFNQHIK